MGSFSFPRLVVFCLLLLLSCFFGCLFFFFFANKHETRRKKINKRYEEEERQHMKMDFIITIYNYSSFHRSVAVSCNLLLLSISYVPAYLSSGIFMSLTAGAGTRCMSLLPTSPTLPHGKRN